MTVPFGKGNSLRTGYVVGMGNTAEYDPSRIKEIAGIAPGSMSVQSQLIRLAWWMRERYGATMNQTLKTVLPVKEKIKPREKKTLHCLLNQEELEAAILAAQKRLIRRGCGSLRHSGTIWIFRWNLPTGA